MPSKSPIAGPPGPPVDARGEYRSIKANLLSDPTLAEHKEHASVTSSFYRWIRGAAGAPGASTSTWSRLVFAGSVALIVLYCIRTPAAQQPGPATSACLQYTGTVTSILRTAEPPDARFANLHVGTTFSGFLHFNPDAIDEDADPDRGVYRTPTTDTEGVLLWQAGDLVVRNVPNIGNLTITVVKSGQLARYTATTTRVSIPGDDPLPQDEFGITLQGATGLFPTDALPLDLPALTAFH